MSGRLSWDDIPSLEGVEVDWGYRPEKARDKRTFVRMTEGAVAQLFEVHEIPVKLATAKQTYTCALVDISEGGVALNIGADLPVGTPVKLGFFLGRHKVITQGVVQHVRRQQGGSIVGIQFVQLPEASREYIAELYASKVLYCAS